MLKDILQALKRAKFKEKKDQDYTRLGIEKAFQRGRQYIEIYKEDWGYAIHYLHPNGEVISIVDFEDIERLEEKITYNQNQY